jgi:hypothetical protein
MIAARSWPNNTGVWADGRRYLGLDALHRSRLTLITNPDHDTPTTSAISA